ncbi:acetoacetate--CoA ligase [Uliginosibacterium sp. H3]|uniref:Acetoacetate--CoA ligase n=1 Tax=Uliginosibacterium silvisoli TaxID=3114758 RepID=A0ABU6K3T5_9RHOO|nr:acetoacetate--CoA ligase [Uliginosibacterium sp. H3]
MSDLSSAAPLWQPDAAHIAATRLTAFTQFVAQRHARTFTDYTELHRWSVTQATDFWSAVWDFCGVLGKKGSDDNADLLRDGDRMPGARWFPDAQLNFARNLLRRRDAADAIVFQGEDKLQRRLSHATLYAEVARLAAALRAAGVGPGDRVAAYMPNMPETAIAMLATSSLGAVFSSASQDFGVQGVLDRFGQIEPKVLIAADGVFYGGKTLDAMARIAEIVAQLPSLSATVIVPYTQSEHALEAIRGGAMWADFLAPHASEEHIDFVDMPFNAPLYIMFSSGTTGVPKCIVHGVGGTLLQHMKEHQLHSDIRPDDRVFYFTTCGWMMWNWLVSSLASGATLLLYDGSPFVSRGQLLWDFVSAERCSLFGTSAKYIDAAAKLGLNPAVTHDLSALRAVLSTGSPLSPEGFEYVYRDIKSDICLSSVSGGTDIVSCFVLGNPNGPVWRGELQAKGLGLAVEVFDETGKPLEAGKGELVCTRPFPCMPVAFWNDPDGARYHAAYFERFPNIWCHGDWSEEVHHAGGHVGMIIYGRSDATLNPGGVRIGTAEIYRQVEKLPEVLESIVIGQDFEGDVRVVLFVKLREGLALDDELVASIKQVIRQNASPRHVPAKILQVPDIPRTKSGKIVELAVRAVVHGQEVKNVEALANPEALEHFRNRAELM